MASSVRADIIGWLSKDSATDYTQSGMARLKFTVPHDPKVQDGTPAYTNWYECVIFGKRAESVGRFLLKGQQVHVRGALAVRSYQAKDGGTKASLDVLVDELDLLGSPTQGTQAAVEDSIPF